MFSHEYGDLLTEENLSSFNVEPHLIIKRTFFEVALPGKNAGEDSAIAARVNCRRRAYTDSNIDYGFIHPHCEDSDRYPICHKLSYSSSEDEMCKASQRTSSTTDFKDSEDGSKHGEEHFSDMTSEICGSEASFALTDDGFECDAKESSWNQAHASCIESSGCTAPHEVSHPVLQARAPILWACTHGNVPLGLVDAQTQEFGLRAEELDAKAAMLKMYALRAEVAAQQALLEARSVRQRHPDAALGAVSSPWERSFSKASSSKSSKAKPKSKEAKPQNTTLMLRRLPEHYTRESLLDLLDSQGFAGAYDFVYLPADFIKWQSFGYAFINFTSHSEALRAWQHFEGFHSCSDSKSTSEHPTRGCEVTWGTPLQGLHAHVDRYRNSPVMHKDVPEQCKPLIFSQGVRIEFPPPTKRIRQPRLKYGNPADITLPVGLTCETSNA